MKMYHLKQDMYQSILSDIFTKEYHNKLTKSISFMEVNGPKLYAVLFERADYTKE